MICFAVVFLYLFTVMCSAPLVLDRVKLLLVSDALSLEP